jgi:hypothetical protein
MVIAGTAVVCCAWQQATFPCWWRAHKYSTSFDSSLPFVPGAAFFHRLRGPCSALLASSPLLCSAPFRSWIYMEFLASSGGREFVAGGVGGMAGVLTGHPLDTLRIRLQQPQPHHSTASAVLRGILRADGPAALYRGMSAPLASVAFQVTFLASYVFIHGLLAPLFRLLARDRYVFCLLLNYYSTLLPRESRQRKFCSNMPHPSLTNLVTYPTRARHYTLLRNCFFSFNIFSLACRVRTLV